MCKPPTRHTSRVVVESVPCGVHPKLAPPIQNNVIYYYKYSTERIYRTLYWTVCIPNWEMPMPQTFSNFFHVCLCQMKVIYSKRCGMAAPCWSHRTFPRIKEEIVLCWLLWSQSVVEMTETSPFSFPWHHWCRITHHGTIATQILFDVDRLCVHCMIQSD